MARMYDFYKDTVVKQLTDQFGYKSAMEVPRITKITLNMGVGEAVGDKKVMDFAVGDMTKIAGQKPVVTKSRKSIASFKIRDNYPVGCMVTLRRERMYEFLDRLVSLALPRVRDFRGISRTAFDQRGNYSLGLAEQLVFPELNPDKYVKVQGMNITLVTTATNDEEALELLTLMGLPFRRDETAAGVSLDAAEARSARFPYALG